MIATLFNDLFGTFWSQRNPRERRMLQAGFIFVVLALVYLLGLDPALKKKNKLEKEIPQLRQQAAEMQVMAAQYTQIASAIAGGVTPVTRELVDTSLERRGIKAQSLSVTEEFVRLQVNSVGYDNMMEWLLEMQKALHLAVEDAKVTALSESGQVAMVITLRQQRSAN